jgi:hypothetical protein
MLLAHAAKQGDNNAMIISSRQCIMLQSFKVTGVDRFWFHNGRHILLPSQLSDH